MSQEAKTVVECITAVARRPRHFCFRVEVSCGAETFVVRVSARQLLDFDAFQAAALRQTGRLVMPPCCQGAEGPDHYRRVRGNWCRELRNTRWLEEPQTAKEPLCAPAPSANSPASPAASDKPSASVVPAPKGLEKFARKSG